MLVWTRFGCMYVCTKPEPKSISDSKVLLHLVTFQSTVCSEISETFISSHGGEDIDCDLLGCDAVWTCRYIPTFRRIVYPLS
jgi:hypothetical protein